MKQNIFFVLGITWTALLPVVVVLNLGHHYPEFTVTWDTVLSAIGCNFPIYVFGYWAGLEVSKTRSAPYSRASNHAT